MDGFKAIESGRVLGAAVGGVLAVAFALALSPGAGASESLASDVKIVGAATLNWPRVTVRAKPTESSRRVTVLKEFRSDYSPQYVLALARLDHPKTGDASWYRITIPGRPNGRTGWVRAAALEVRPVKKRLVIDRSERRFEFWQGERRLRSGKVAVGKRGARTPTGLFHVQSKFVPNAPILGAFAFETSAYSQLTDWPGGGVVGVHGTPWPWLLGQAVSHGCIRLSNDDVLWLRSRMPLGTPVVIVR